MSSVKNLQKLRDEANRLRILSIRATEASKSGYELLFIIIKIIEFSTNIEFNYQTYSLTV